MKLDVFRLKRPDRPTDTRSFPDPSGETLTLTLRAPDAADAARAAESAEELIRTYITGSEIRDAAPFPDPEVGVSRTLFHTAALIAEMQPEDAEERYSAIELAIVMVKLPVAWRGVQGWTESLIRDWTARRGESPAQPTVVSVE